MWEEFKEFIMRGNVLDLAVGVVIGSAFTAIVTALVDYIITPIILAISGNANIEDLSIAIGPAQLGVGAFLQAIIDFFIIAIILFFIIKGVNSLASRLSKEESEEEEELTAEDYLAEIRDILASESNNQTIAEAEDENTEQTYIK